MRKLYTKSRKIYYGAPIENWVVYAYSESNIFTPPDIRLYRKLWWRHLRLEKTLLTRQRYDMDERYRTVIARHGGLSENRPFWLLTYPMLYMHIKVVVTSFPVWKTTLITHERYKTDEKLQQNTRKSRMAGLSESPLLEFTRGSFISRSWWRRIYPVLQELYRTKRNGLKVINGDRIWRLPWRFANRMSWLHSTLSFLSSQ